MAALGLSLHAFAIRYAQEARSYALTMLVVSAAALILVRFVERGGRTDLAGWVLASVLAVYAHFFAALSVAAQAISLAALGPSELKRRRLLGAGLAGIALLCLPVLLTLARADRALLSWVPDADLQQILKVARALAGGEIALVVFYAVAFAVLLARIRREPRAEARWGATLAVSWAIVPLLAAASVSQWSPMLIERYVSMSAPAWPLCAGAVIGPLLDRSRRRLLGLAMLGVLLALEGRQAAAAYRDDFEDWRIPAMQISTASLPGDAIIFEHRWGGLALGYYLELMSHRPEPLQSDFLFKGDFDLEEAARRNRIWFVVSRHDPASSWRIHEVLLRTHAAVAQADYVYLRVVLYERNLQQR